MKLDPRKLRGRRLVFLAACVAILAGAGSVLATAGHGGNRSALPDLSGVHSASRSDRALGRVVAKLAHRDTDVQCWSHADWSKRVAEYSRRWPNQAPLGPWSAYTAYSPTLTVNVSPEVCIELTRLARRKGPLASAGPPAALAKALQVLTHESAHVAGFLDEATAECYAMQSIRAAAVDLGRTSSDGASLAALYWSHWYPRDDVAFRSSECRNGGALDLRPHSAVWP